MLSLLSLFLLRKQGYFCILLRCFDNQLLRLILLRDELAMLAKANEEQAAIGFLPRRLRR
jgi:hypothetical protein